MELRNWTKKVVMKTRNVSDFMSDFGIIKISGNIPMGGVREFSRVPCLIIIQNASSSGDAGLYMITSNNVTSIKQSSGISINDNSSNWLQIKAEGNVLKFINNRPDSSLDIKGMLLQL